MIKVGRPEKLDTTSLWTVLTGGATLSEFYLKKLRDLLPGTFIFQGYGQTEAGGILTLFKTRDAKERMLLYNKPNSVGTPFSGISYKV